MPHMDSWIMLLGSMPSGVNERSDAHQYVDCFSETKHWSCTCSTSCSIAALIAHAANAKNWNEFIFGQVDWTYLRPRWKKQKKNKPCNMYTSIKRGQAFKRKRTARYPVPILTLHRIAFCRLPLQSLRRLPSGLTVPMVLYLMRHPLLPHASPGKRCMPSSS